MNIRSSPPICAAINVKYSISAGTATAGSDFTPVSGTVEMVETVNMVGLRVNTIDDSIADGDKTVILTLLPDADYELGTHQKLGERTTMTLTIVDDDMPIVSFASAGRTVSEAAGTVNVRMDIAPAPTSAMTVLYAINADPANFGTARVGSDLTAIGCRPWLPRQCEETDVYFVSVPAGATSVTIPVTIIDDSASEGHETVVLTLLSYTGIDGGHLWNRGGRVDHTLTIADNDTPQISFASAGQTVNEAAGTVNARMDIAPAPTSAMTLSYTVGGGTANLFTDPWGERDFRMLHPVSVPPGVTTMNIVNNYRVANLRMRSVSVPAGATRVTIPMTIIDDSVIESNETVVLTLLPGTGYNLDANRSGQKHTLTIADNDTPLPTVNITSAAGGDEGDDVTFVITANPAPASALPVSITVTAVGDYGISGGARTVSIPTSGSFTLTLPTTDDTVDEENGSVTLTLESGAGYTVGALSSQTASITNDDLPRQRETEPTQPTISITGGSAVAEGGDVTFTLTADPVPAANLPVTVSVTESGDVASSGATGTRTVTIGTGGTVDFTVATEDDAIDEADGSIAATITTGTGYTVGSVATASVTVADNDVPTVSITGGSSVTEGGDATFTLTASPAPAANLPVTVSVTENGSVASSGATGTRTVTIGTSGTVDFTVATEDDAIDEADGSIEATVTAGTGYTVGSVATASVAVRDNDDTNPYTALIARVRGYVAETANGEEHVNRWQRVLKAVGEDDAAFAGLTPMTASEAQTYADKGWTRWNEVVTALTALEAAAQPPVQPTITIAGGSAVTEGGDVTFTLTANPAPAANLAVTVSVTENGNVATSGETGARTVTIGTGGTVDFTVATEDDDVDEADGSIAATVTAGTGYTVGSVATASVVVRDDEVPTISIAGGSAVTEGGDVVFTLTADPVPAANLPVTVSVSESGNVANSGATGTRTVTIGTGGTVAFTVSTEDDDVDEADGSIAATVTAGTGYTVGSTATASVVVRDDEVPTVSIAGGSAVTEGGDVTFTLTADPVPAANLAVTVSVTESGNFAASGQTGARTVTVGTGGTVDFTVSTENDAVDEADGSIAATVTTGTGYTVGSVVTASVAVADNDVPPPEVNITSAAGGSEGADVTFV
ncbi:MAG: hypothetical protein OXF25_09455, partial [Cyanobacteria bacterium MAG CAR3_bin_5]|nr:hypothetical protein [Cyanobacteria bacterium MAG CAR3_bin_5]